MKNDYEVVKDFGVTDEASPIFGSHATGQTVDCTDEVAAPFVEAGNLKLVPKKDQEENKKLLSKYTVLKEEGITIEGTLHDKDSIIELKPHLKKTEALVESKAIELVPEE